MADVVNPYRLWLEIDTDASTLNHYELLGLPAYEDDGDKIHHAADRAMALVRGHRPGAHAAAWAQLLDDIARAKACLTDPAQKAAYDTSLRASLATAHSTPEEPGQPEIAAVNQMPDLFPPGMAPAVEPEDEPAEMPIPVPEESEAEAATPVVPATTANEADAGAAAAGPATPPHRKPPPPPGDANVVSRADRLLNDPFEGNASPAAQLSEVTPAAPVNAHVAPPEEKKPSILPMALVVFAVVAVITTVVGILAVQQGLLGGGSSAVQAPAEQPGTKQPGSSTVAPRKVINSSASGGTPPTNVLGGSDGQLIRKPVTMGTYQPKTSAEKTDPQAIKPDKNGTDPESGSTPEPKQTDPGRSAKTSPKLADEGEDPETPKAPVQPNSADIAAFKQATVALQVALGGQDFDRAQLELENAKAAAKTDEQESMVTGYTQLTDLAEQFWKTVGSTVEAFEGAEELKVGSGGLIVLVVETGPETITIRKEGRNLKYAFTEMPPGLALAIARQKLSVSQPDHLAQLGACLATAPDRKQIYLDEARKYWEQARTLGADIDQLLLTLVP